MDNKTIVQRLRRISDSRRSQVDREALGKAVVLIEELDALREDVLAVAEFPDENSDRLAEALVRLLGLAEVVKANGERQLTSVPQVRLPVAQGCPAPAGAGSVSEPVE